ncbi:MAG: hypothetical protein GXY36_03895 [Chloroflexi bacterium]|nr:hypothetical protein [Chloroflexota bacterium]
MNRDELLELIPAYALDALDPDERAEVEAWLPTDPEAQALLAEYQAVTDQLALLVPQQAAPAHLHTDLRQRLAATHATQERPALPPAPIATGSVFRGRTARRVVAAAAALLILIAAGLVIWQVSEQEPEPVDEGAALYAELDAQEDAPRYALEPAEDLPGVMGELVASPDGDEAVIRVEQLPTLPGDQAFQLWLVDAAGTVTSGGVFNRQGDADATFIRVPLEQPLDAYQRFGVSIEPAGGSPFPDRPTGPRVFSVQLS